MKAIDKLQVGNHIHVAKLSYKGIKAATITTIEHNQIFFRYNKGMRESEGVATIDCVTGINLLEQDMEPLMFEKISTASTEYSCKYYPDFKIQVRDKVITYKELPLLYIHQLQNLFFAITGKTLIVSKDYMLKQ